MGYLKRRRLSESAKRISSGQTRLIDIALDYISNLKEEDLLKLITEYYGRKHISHTSM